MKHTTGRGPKNKGREFENEVRDRMLNILPLLPDDISCRSMGDPGIDILLSPDARAVFPFGVETKRTEKLALWAALRQAETNARAEGLSPLLVFRRNRSTTYAVLELDVLLRMIKKIANHEGLGRSPSELIDHLYSGRWL